MRGFEVVVRPAVLPNIRPAPAQSLPPLDDPDKGFAVIRGNGAKQIDLSSSWSSSTSMNQFREIERRVDEVRVYQMDDAGNVNRDNFVDIEVANRITERGPKQKTPDLQEQFRGTSTGVTSEGTVYVHYYRGPPTGEPNIEVQRANVIQKFGSGSGEE